MTSTLPTAFEEEEEHHFQDNGNKKSTHEDGAVHLNVTSSAPPTYTSHVKNGSTTYNNRRSDKAGGVCSRITKDTLFRVFLLLLILALLIPILVLVALIYQQGGHQDDMGNNRMQLPIIANPGQSNSVAGEDPATPQGAKTGKEYQQQMDEIYKREPWRRDPTSAWKQLGSSLSDSIDPRGDACTDLYGYSCDQWKDRNPLNERKEISEETLAYENVKTLILQTFDGMKKNDNSWPASVLWAKSYYDQCTSIDDAELAERKKSIVDFLHSIFPGSAQPQHIVKRRSVDDTLHDMSNHTNVTDHVVDVPIDMDHDHVNVTVNGSIDHVNMTGLVIPILNGPEATTHVHTIPPMDNLTVTPEPVHPVETVHPNDTHTDNTSHVDIPTILHTEPTQAPQSGRDIWDLAGDVCQAGAVSFFDVDFSKNPKNPDDLKTILRPPTLTLPSRRYYLEPYLSSKKLPALENSIVDTIKLFKATPGSDSALLPLDGARDVVQFEQALAKASPTTRPIFDFEFDELQTHFPNAKAYTLSNLESRWPRVNWEAFLPEQVKKSGNQSNLTPFIITDPGYIDQLVGLLEDYNHQTAVNFLKWRYIYSVADHLKNDDTVNSTCYADLENDMPLALAHIVYKTNYGVTQDEKSKMIYTPESIQAIFNRTVRAFKSITEYSSQVSNTSRKSISDEVGNRVLTTDWPDMIKDGKTLDSIYSGNLQAPQNGTFIDQLNALRSSDFLDDQSNLWSNVIPEVFTSIQYVGGNSIAMIYDPRIINGQLSQAAVAQFSTVGWQMGRELTKSVRYLSKTPFQSSRVDQCLINQYNQFCYPSPINSCVDGQWTLCDNVADTVGLEVAYKAYKTWESNMAMSGANDAFPAFLAASNLGKFTLDQIFFLSYGTSFCDNESKEYTIDSLATQETAPQEYRLKGTAMNSNDFQLAFHCKAGDKLYSNPRERCQFV